MVMRLGRYGEFLACSMYPEHKETRELPGAGGRRRPGRPATGRQRAARPSPRRPRPAPSAAAAEGGVLVQRRGRFGPFMGCSRYPDCDYIKKDGPPPPGAARLRGCLPHVPAGPPGDAPRAPDRVAVLGLLALPEVRLHDVPRACSGRSTTPTTGPVGRPARRALCLACGAPVELPASSDLVGRRLAGGEPNPGRPGPTSSRPPARHRPGRVGPAEPAGGAGAAEDGG